MANLRPKVLNANGYDELLDDGDNIQLVAAPATDDAAANKAYVDQQIDAINNPGGDPIYVRKAGDNMTGDLTLGTDKIVLSVSGSAAFGGSSISSDALGVYLNDGNVSSWNTASTNLWTGFTAGNTTPTSTINGGGSATFGSGNIALNSNGTATFADKVTTGGTNGRGQFLGLCPSSVTASSADAYVARYDGADKFNVKYDGSATFAANISAGTSIYSQSPNPSAYNFQAKDSAGTAYFAVRSTGTNSGEVIVGGTLNPYAPNIELKRDGSATFTGALEAASIDGGSY